MKFKIIAILKSHFTETKTLIAIGKLCGVKRFPFEFNNHYRDRVYKSQLMSRSPVISTKERLKSVLDHYFSRYTVTTYRDVKKTGVIEISIPLGKNHPEYCEFMETIRNEMPVTFWPDIFKLAWNENLSNERQWIEED